MNFTFIIYVLFRTRRSLDGEMLEMFHYNYRQAIQMRHVRQPQSVQSMLQVKFSLIRNVLFYLTCLAIFSQVHEIHPSHPFLLIQEKLVRSQSEPAIELPTLTPDETGELRE